ncbi:hypothetical protein BT96DRAFT_247450 [Gymnopus androsaceus JB14]|uniref:Uncharacterized protein n=1 Tax=Gymnopus androsaceus JB14 TaxID=1447944 RepID=A0A6A4IKU8_9AGAR|nr:hypothetical protein BT96DRAFT_247450 [Gymnopus androsaceus JB14]
MLQKIRFIDRTRFRYCHNLLLLSFTIHFQDQMQKEGLNDTFDLSKLVIGRAAQTSEEWHVTGLGVVVKRSLSQVLSLISSCFPKVSVLTVEFKGEDVYHIDELISLLRKYPSLHTLGLRLSFNRLHFDGQKPWTQLCSAVPDPRNRKTLAAVSAEAGMLWYTSRIAQAISLIEAFFIHEEMLCWLLRVLDRQRVVYGRQRSSERYWDACR